MQEDYISQGGKIIQGDIREIAKTLESNSVHCIITSPPYWGLRDYGVEGQLGLEQTPNKYVSNLVKIFRELKRVLRDDGTLWLNLGDSYAANRSYQVPSTKGGPKHSPAQGNSSNNKVPLGLKSKDLVGIPWHTAFSLRKDGWYLRQDIIWQKPNTMPESVKDRCTKAHEYIFLLTKNAKYYYDVEAIKEPASEAGKRVSLGKKSFSKGQAAAGIKPSGNGLKDYYDVPNFRNKRDVWTVTTKPYKGAHFATFPPDLIKPCILAGTSEKGCCPHCGKPWERVIERVDTGYDGSRYGERAVYATGGVISGGTKKSTLGSSNGKLVGYAKTIDWKQSCTCKEHEPIPCTVLDPFMGSGTTAMVAKELGRNWLGIELNQEYIELAKKRIENQK